MKLEDKKAHEQAMKTAIDDIAQFLQEVLGQKLTAIVAGVTDRGTVGRWANRVSEPRPDSDARLREAYRIFHQLQAHDSADVVRAWFVGSNPHLDDESPAVALSKDRFKQVSAAARAFVDAG
ncbi:XRE family transcriptional regulator [Streptomyces rishiriensis]|uniref:Secreted protein n=1 Tax=Streptomyces rishiriensis TaxID=68264 RepID=A0ABU0NFI9_STRRH|nr:XRE family transcriptional regulator [Streptomyces rishiriensis]MDQ0577859.1 putative secreted protein [Streptomyces rishiriensis]